MSSLFCPRKAVLSERFRSTEPTNQIMLNGTLIHRLLQTVITHDLPLRLLSATDILTSYLI